MKATRIGVVIALIPSIVAMTVIYANQKKQPTDIVDLGTLGGENSEATAINSAGDIVGQADITGATEPNAFLWRHGQMTELPMFVNIGDPSSPPADSYAYSINNDGVIVGDCDTGAGDLNGNGRGPYHAVSWTNGSIRDLGLLPGYQYSSARSINDAGLVVGLGINESRGPRSNVYEERVGIFAPGNRPQLLNTKLYARNSKGNVVDLIQKRGGVSIRLTVHGASRVLGDIQLPDYPLSVVVNDCGQVVATIAREVVSTNGGVILPGSYVVAWLHNATRTQLSPLPGYPDARARGINNKGEVVGEVNNRDINHLSTCGVLWKESGALDLTQTYAKDSDWRIESAAGINDSGVIVGRGTKNGVHHAIMLKSRA